MVGSRRLSTAPVVEFEWIPDPVVFADRILVVADALEDRTVPILAARQKVQEDIRMHFETETAPDGEPWKEWADSYQPVAEEFPNIGILRQTDTLYETASSSAAFIVSNDTLFYDPGYMPERGIWHQEGRPTRTNQYGASNPLPARPFLGLSDQEEMVIYGFFQDWFDRAVDLYVTPTGRLRRFHSRRGKTTPKSTAGSFAPNP